MKQEMSTDNVDTGSFVGDGNEVNDGCTGSGSVDNVDDSFALNESEESAIDKTDVIRDKNSQDDADDNREGDHRPLNEEQAKATSIARLLEIDQATTTTKSSSKFYKYRDFSDVTEMDIQKEIGANPNRSTTLRNSGARSTYIQKFPVKLYAILAQKEFQDIIAWMPHGRSWKVLKPNLFESLVMPSFFQCGNYHSFNRLVNAWSFRRITTGVDNGSYYHELFLRGKPCLQKFMRRLPKTHKKPPMRTEDEPDFYAMDKEKPLPQCTLEIGPNHITTLYPTPFGMASSGVAPMLRTLPMQVPLPIQWQPRYNAIAGATTWGFGGINDANYGGEAPLVCGVDGMGSQNMHSMGMPMMGASALLSTGASTGGMNGIMGNGGICANDIGDVIETGMNINSVGAGDMGIGSADASQGAFDIEDPIEKDGPMGL
eukprot:CAMPEP_0116102408 /NCGR_PEP_ID=MMETSP0327-20121206/13333_1 /TAXON_ID=44447 /ORGANISM="Pseudo-nitzschia delicatissima, Strain B596" /LENGTH=428 /DNA_ID=CAMNT_0003594445 /DNA_START=214 /DNA_END=1500 /DNA_ORIENTATION=+